MEQTPRRRKLLVATVGVATVSYAMALAACGKENTPVSGNLPAPPPPDTATSPVSGNLVAPTPPDAAAPSPVTGNLPAPPPPVSPIATSPDAGPAGTGKSPVSGNLVAPPRRDAGK